MINKLYRNSAIYVQDGVKLRQRIEMPVRELGPRWNSVQLSQKRLLGFWPCHGRWTDYDLHVSVLFPGVHEVLWRQATLLNLDRPYYVVKLIMEDKFLPLRQQVWDNDAVPSHFYILHKYVTEAQGLQCLSFTLMNRHDDDA